VSVVVPRTHFSSLVIEVIILSSNPEIYLSISLQLTIWFISQPVYSSRRLRRPFFLSISDEKHNQFCPNFSEVKVIPVLN
jgi:hypothetical protein